MLLNSFNGIMSSAMLSRSLSSSPVLNTSALTINLVPSSLVVSMPNLIDVSSPLNIGVPLLRSQTMIFEFGAFSLSKQLDGVLVNSTPVPGNVMRICAKYAVSPLFSMLYRMLNDELLPRIYGKLNGQNNEH